MADTHNSVMLLNADGTGTEYGATGGSGGTKVKATYDQTPALYSHNVGDIIYFNNYFYKATQAIAVGNTIAVGTNIQIAGLAKDTAVYIENLPGDGDPIQAQIDAIVNVYGSKNLNSYPYYVSTKTESGITWTDNGNGTITVSGTASANTNFNCQSWDTRLRFGKGSYKISGGISTDCYLYIVYSIDGGSQTGYSMQNTDEFTLTCNSSLEIALVYAIQNGANFTTPITLKPMIRDARITDPTWVPFAMTNRQLTESVEELNSNLVKINALGAVTETLTANTIYNIALSDVPNGLIAGVVFNVGTTGSSENFTVKRSSITKLSDNSARLDIEVDVTQQYIIRYMLFYM